MSYPLDPSLRHQSVREIRKHFSYEHLPEDLKAVSATCAHLADTMMVALPDTAELTVGLRKLLEAKDCFVRAAVAARDA